jgi:hypothetical protein
MTTWNPPLGLRVKPYEVPFAMRKTLTIFLALGMLIRLWGQDISSNPAGYTPEQVDELVAPIALYPDPLVALILPASTVPSDIVLASRYFDANGDPNQVDSQPWDDSVRALAHYPTVIKWLDDNLDWTTTLGRVFMLEPTQVMESVQQLRAQARANGTLVDTPQQNVVLDGSDIDIVPAQPNSICVPEYDPDLVFADQPVDYGSPLIIFGPPCWVGPWLDFECDWDDYDVWIGVWRPGWDYLRDWRQPRSAWGGLWASGLRDWQQPHSAANRGNYWKPDPVRQREATYAATRSFATLARPQPMVGAPRATASIAQSNRPAIAGSSSRPDTTGWRVDAQGHLAVTPAPAARPAGPQVILSGASVASQHAPEASYPVNRPAPEVDRPAPASAAPPVNYPVSPFPAGVAPPFAPNPGTQVQVGIPGAGPATGVLFGGYSRGTEARDFSNRGQASLQAARPAAPVARSAPEEAPSRSEPSSGGGNDGDQRKR